MEQVEKRIQKVFGQHTNVFKNLLDTTGAVISGSFIIQAILDEKWENSDIDVFILNRLYLLSYKLHHHLGQFCNLYLFENLIFHNMIQVYLCFCFGIFLLHLQ